VISPDSASDSFRSIRYQYQMLLHALLNQYNSNMPPQIAYDISTNSPELNFSKFAKNQLTLSRYQTDFVEIEKLASGGFGFVYKVKLF
jgi:hypothetical protein